MSPTDCPLCRLVAAPAAAPMMIASNEHAIAVLHEDWAVRGHGMVVSSEHVENFSDLAPEEAAGFIETYERFERALLDVFDADRVILLKLGLAVPHLHWHLYPVSRSTTRQQIFEAFDVARSDEPDDAAKAALIAELKQRM